MLRFDVGKQRYTTFDDEGFSFSKLRFDVGKQRYTTAGGVVRRSGKLRFDVGKQRYTTIQKNNNQYLCCGLM